MPRIAGVDIPKQKPIYISLTYIFGIGPETAKNILGQAEVEETRRAGELSDQEVAAIQNIIFHGHFLTGSGGMAQK